MSKKNNLVAVYGTLRLGQGNHHVLSDNNAIYLGAFQSPPEYTMYTMGGFPALVERGTTSIYMEVFKVDDKGLKQVDSLEGYREDSETRHYNRITISTPWGPAYLYVYDSAPINRSVISSGDWKEHEEIKRVNYAL